MGLNEYRRKRDFAKTPEPSGGKGESAAGKPRAKKAKAAKGEAKAETKAGAEKPAPAGETRSFVIQKHDASRLHYDFRLEAAGTLKSWAVPKGPSLDPSQKRLAVRVEDHPVEYADFEGSIPEEEYGGGTVMIWDEGKVTYEGTADEAAKLIDDRSPLSFRLEGRKLGGLWRLIPLKGRPGDKGDNWLLIKSGDDKARREGDVLNDQPDSARTGRSMEKIASESTS